MTTDTSTVGTAPTTTPTAEKKPRVHSAQNQKMANTITGALQITSQALSIPEIVAALSERGYDAPGLQVGLELQSAAQSAFDSCQNSPTTKAEAKQMRDEAFEAALTEYSGYRQTVQAVTVFKASDRTTLGADGKMTRDLQKFVTNATAAYQAAQKEPYTTVLSKRSYTVTRLNNAIAALKTLATYDNAYTGAKAMAKGSTAARDEAFDALTAWLSEFRTNARLALEKDPVLLEKLGL